MEIHCWNGNVFGTIEQSDEMWRELVQKIRKYRQKLKNTILNWGLQTILDSLKQYNENKKIVIGQGQRLLNQEEFADFMINLQNDKNPQELFNMVKENDWISVQKMQFFNQHYWDDRMRKSDRGKVFQEKFEHKIPEPADKK